MPAPHLAQRLGLAALSTVLAGAGAWWFLANRVHEGATVEIVDDGKEFQDLLGSREIPEEDRILLESAAELGKDFARRLREDLTEKDAITLFPQLKRGSNRMVPGVHFALVPDKRWHRDFAEHPDGEFPRHTNSLGLREDSEPPEVPADLCVLVMGDSHTEGVCANAESLANRLEARLRKARPEQSVDVWNTAVGGYGVANYLGTLEAHGHLEPQDVVLVYYGGNDFREALAPWRYLYRRPAGRIARLDLSPLRDDGNKGVALLGQEIHQALSFLADPDSREDALRLAVACGLELDRQCRERGLRFLFVYLPPPSSAQPQHYRARLEEAMGRIGADPSGLDACKSLADDTLLALSDAGVATLDLRPAFAVAPEPLYWNMDLHLNLLGHSLAAEQIQAAFYSSESKPH